MSHDYILPVDLSPDHAKRCAYVVDQLRHAVRALLDSVVDAPKLSDIPLRHRRQVTLTALAQAVGVLVAETVNTEDVPAAVTSLVDAIVMGTGGVSASVSLHELTDLLNDDGDVRRDPPSVN